MCVETGPEDPEALICFLSIDKNGTPQEPRPRPELNHLLWGKPSDTGGSYRTGLGQNEATGRNIADTKKSVKLFRW